MSAKKKVVTFKRKSSGKPAKDYMKTIERLILILSKLNTNKFVTTAGLAEDIGVDMRTIQRDMVLLSGFYPIFSPEKGKHSFTDGFNLGKMELTEEQASLLSFMHSISSSMGEKFERSFRDLFKRVVTPQVDTPFYAKLPKGIKLPCDAEVVKVLEAAIDKYDRIHMHYVPRDGVEKHYDLEPLKIALYDGFWYLITNDVAREKIIKLRLDRIKSVEKLDQSFVPPDNLMTLLEQSVNVWFEEKRGERVLIKVAPESAQYFKKKSYFPMQKIVKENRDGSLILETFPGHLEEISHIIMNWIPCLTVIEPATFKDAIQATVKKYLNLIEERR